MSSEEPKADPPPPLSQDVACLLLINSIDSRRGPITDERERLFLIQLGSYVDATGWDESDFNAFSQLYTDYVDCLAVIGPAARDLGLRVSFSAMLFNNPKESIKASYVMSFLSRLVELRPSRIAGLT